VVVKNFSLEKLVDELTEALEACEELERMMEEGANTVDFRYAETELLPRIARTRRQ
jgi:hypothetical protein